jgi:hypothetical protein
MMGYGFGMGLAGWIFMGLFLVGATGLAVWAAVSLLPGSPAARHVQFRALVVGDEQPLLQVIHGYLAAEGFPNGRVLLYEHVRPVNPLLAGWPTSTDGSIAPEVDCVLP